MGDGAVVTVGPGLCPGLPEDRGLPGPGVVEDRDPLGRRKPLMVYPVTLRPGKIDQVQGDDHRHPEFGNLERQVEGPLHVCRINDLDDDVRVSFEDEILGDDLIRRVGRKAVGAGGSTTSISYPLRLSRPVFFSTVTPGQFPTCCLKPVST